MHFSLPTFTAEFWRSIYSGRLTQKALGFCATIPKGNVHLGIHLPAIIAFLGYDPRSKPENQSLGGRFIAYRLG